MRFASLGSGSKGNSTIIEAGSTVVLVDCGFGIRSLTTRLLARNVVPEQITAILITHEHSDHWKGLRFCLRSLIFLFIYRLVVLKREISLLILKTST